MTMPGGNWVTVDRETSAHRIEGEADPLLVVTDGAPGLIAGADPRRNGPVGQPWTSCPRRTARMCDLE